jgi:hypothetical protein
VIKQIYTTFLPHAKNHNNNEHMIVLKIFKNITPWMINFIHYDMDFLIFT